MNKAVLASALAVASASVDESEFDIGIGAGIRYSFSDTFAVVADYKTASDLDTLSVGAQYSF